MTYKKQLVLDIAGVLVTNFSPHFWKALSEKTETPYEMLVLFKEQIRADFWSGKIFKEGFWTQLCQRFPQIRRDDAETMLFSFIKPLPQLTKSPHGANMLTFT
jgi:hypothetical protein